MKDYHTTVSDVHFLVPKSLKFKLVCTKYSFLNFEPVDMSYISGSVCCLFGVFVFVFLFCFFWGGGCCFVKFCCCCLSKRYFF